MSAAPSSLRRTRAFTLLEVLLAVAVFAVVLAAIHAVFYGALRLRNKTVAAFELAVPLQHTLAILKRDLANIVVPGGTLFGQLQTTPTSTNTAGSLRASALATATTSASGLAVLTSPTFHTAAGIIDDLTPWGEVEKVQYYLAEPTNNTFGFDLYRSVTRNLLPPLMEEPEDQWLMSGIDSFYFYFYDGMEWLDTWDSTQAATPLPAAIKVEIYLAVEDPGLLAPEPIQMVVPILVQGGTNQTSQATNSAGGPL